MNNPPTNQHIPINQKSTTDQQIHIINQTFNQQPTQQPKHNQLTHQPISKQPPTNQTTDNPDTQSKKNTYGGATTKQ